MSGVVSVFWNGGGLGTSKSDVSRMFFDSILQRSSSLADVDFINPDLESARIILFCHVGVVVKSND